MLQQCIKWILNTLQKSAKMKWMFRGISRGKWRWRCIRLQCQYLSLAAAWIWFGKPWQRGRRFQCTAGDKQPLRFCTCRYWSKSLGMQFEPGPEMELSWQDEVFNGENQALQKPSDTSGRRKSLLSFIWRAVCSRSMAHHQGSVRACFVRNSGKAAGNN